MTVSRGAPDVVLSDADDALRVPLDTVHRTILRHPVAAQAAFAALVAEGRAYAETDDGRALAEQLRGSELLERLRMVWESASLGMLERDPDVILPGALVEALAALASRQGLETMLSDWFARHPGARG